MQKSSHSVADLRYRILLKTNGPLLQGAVREYVRSECVRLICHINGSVIGADMGDDYICLLVSLPPRVSVSEAVNVLKGVSARLARKQYLEQIREYVKGSSFWAPYYYAATAEGTTSEELLAAANVSKKEEDNDYVDDIER